MLTKAGCLRRSNKDDVNARIQRSAGAAVAATIRAGAETYDRTRDLPKLTRLAPREFQGDSIDVATMIVARLERALRAERNRARSGHWTYDLNRHIALRQAHLAESERLRMLREAQS